MITTSQLEQLGIKVSLIEKPDTSLVVSSNSPQQCVLATPTQPTVCQSISISSGDTEVSSQNLISHAFSAAMGILLNNLQSESETVPINSAPSDSVMLSDVLSKEDSINLKINGMGEGNKHDGTLPADERVTKSGTVNWEENTANEEPASQADGQLTDKCVLETAHHTTEQDNLLADDSKQHGTDESSRTVHKQFVEGGADQSGDRAVIE